MVMRRPNLGPGPWKDLITELHDLYDRAGWPGARQLARPLHKPHPVHYSYSRVHVLFTRPGGRPPRLPMLLDVVEQLIEMGPRGGATSADLQAEIRDARVRFEKLWRAVIDSDDAPSGDGTGA